jgi:hypothetical protein
MREGTLGESLENSLRETQKPIDEMIEDKTLGEQITGHVKVLQDITDGLEYQL